MPNVKTKLKRHRKLNQVRLILLLRDLCGKIVPWFTAVCLFVKVNSGRWCVATFPIWPDTGLVFFIDSERKLQLLYRLCPIAKSFILVKKNGRGFNHSFLDIERKNKVFRKKTVRNVFKSSHGAMVFPITRRVADVVTKTCMTKNYFCTVRLRKCKASFSFSLTLQL